LHDYTNGDIDVINSVGILTTGVDLPCTEVVIVNRATTSLALWLQMQGRASRTYPGKKEFIVIDFGRNHDEHGLWSEDRDWSIKAPKKKKVGVPPVKDCKGCGAMLLASCRKCEYCGIEMELKEYKLVKGNLVEVVPVVKKYDGVNAWSLNGEQLYDAYTEKSVPFRLAVRIAVKTNQIYTFAQVGGYSKGWAWKQTQIYNNK
jgi:superfamily II DNA or RNA helicase